MLTPIFSLRARAVAIDPRAREVQFEDGSRYHYDRLLLAMGADPVRLGVPGAELSQVHYRRMLGDSRALIAKAEASPRVVVIGASFIGLEVAASMRARDRGSIGRRAPGAPSHR